MRRLIFGVMAGMILPLYSAHASISDDLNSDLPMASVFANAINESISVQDILGSIIDLKPSSGGDAVCAAVSASPDTAPDLAAFAISKGLAPAVVATSSMQCAPEQATQTYAKLKEAGVSDEDLLASALAAGLDPTALQEATAAGNPQGQGQGLGIAPGQTGRRVNPPPFGNNGGGGGGNTASPG